MARIKYYYDTESCKYERVKVSTWDIVTNFLGFLSVSLILAVGLFYVYNTYFESPEVAMLRKENKELLLYYELLSDEMSQANKMLSNLHERDDNVYRVIFEADPIPSSIRSAGVGGVNRYKSLIDADLEREDLILETYKTIDQLKKQMYIQTKSYDEILALARDKQSLYASMPAIQPVSNLELKRLSSGYGMRTDPILKVPKMHAGVDFSAPRGTPVYATGDGTIVSVKTSFGGFGKHIIIDHGFGFETLYGHLDRFEARQGQKIKRGELIGYVGNTGKSTAPHLHYEVFKDGRNVNPVHYFYQDLNDDEYEEILRLASIENQSLGSY